MKGEAPAPRRHHSTRRPPRIHADFAPENLIVDGLRMRLSVSTHVRQSSARRILVDWLALEERELHPCLADVFDRHLERVAVEHD
jgi:hypothetical protein